MSTKIIILIVITIVLTFVASLYAGSETATSSASIFKIQALINQNKNKKMRKAHLAIKLIHNYTITLTTVIIANNLIIVGFTSTVTLLFIQILQSDGLGTSIALIYGTVILIVGGEIIPKWLARRHAEKWTIVWSWLLQGTIYLLYPIVKLLNLLLKDFKRNTASEKELVEIFKNVQKEGEIESYEKDMITNALKFDDTTADTVLIPWKKVTYITQQYTKKQILEVLSNKNYHYIPVLDQTTENIIGILDTKIFCRLYLQQKNFLIQQCVKTPTFVDSKTYLHQIIKQMQQGHSRFCIVYNVEDHDEIVGIITLDDLVDEIFSDITKAEELDENITILKNNKYIVDAELSWNIFCQSFPFNNWNLPNNKYKTVNQWYSKLALQQKNAKKIKFQQFYIKSRQINKKKTLIFTKISH